MQYEPLSQQRKRRKTRRHYENKLKICATNGRRLTIKEKLDQAYWLYKCKRERKKKIEYVGGLKGGLLNLLKDHFKHRKMRTVTNYHKYKQHRVINGVRQGTNNVFGGRSV